LTGALRIDSTQVPVGDGNAIVEKNAQGTMILHVDTLLSAGTGAILQADPKTGVFGVAPLILADLRTINREHLEDEMNLNRVADSNAAIDNAADQLDPTSVVGMATWSPPGATQAVFAKGMQGYFLSKHPDYESALQPALDQITGTNDIKAQGQAILSLSHKIPVGIAVEVCSMLSRHEPTFRCPVTAVIFAPAPPVPSGTPSGAPQPASPSTPPVMGTPVFAPE
jgi:hypothetical protein